MRRRYGGVEGVRPPLGEAPVAATSGRIWKSSLHPPGGWGAAWSPVEVVEVTACTVTLWEEEVCSAGMEDPQNLSMVWGPWGTWGPGAPPWSPLAGPSPPASPPGTWTVPLAALTPRWGPAGPGRTR